MERSYRYIYLQNPRRSNDLNTIESFLCLSEFQIYGRCAKDSTFLLACKVSKCLLFILSIVTICHTYLKSRDSFLGFIKILIEVETCYYWSPEKNQMFKFCIKLQQRGFGIVSFSFNFVSEETLFVHHRHFVL